MKIYLSHTRDEKVMNSVKNSTNQHPIFTSDAFEMENAIRMRAHSHPCYHNTLARLEDEIAMNSISIIQHLHENN